MLKFYLDLHNDVHKHLILKFNRCSNDHMSCDTVEQGIEQNLCLACQDQMGLDETSIP